MRSVTHHEAQEEREGGKNFSFTLIFVCFARFVVDQLFRFSSLERSPL
jgi:hypothetical protein